MDLTSFSTVIFTSDLNLNKLYYISWSSCWYFLSSSFLAWSILCSLFFLCLILSFSLIKSAKTSSISFTLCSKSSWFLTSLAMSYWSLVWSLFSCFFCILKWVTFICNCSRIFKVSFEESNWKSKDEQIPSNFY